MSAWVRREVAGSGRPRAVLGHGPRGHLAGLRLRALGRTAVVDVLKLRDELAERAKLPEDRLTLLDEILPVLADAGVQDEALEILRELNASGARNVPDKAPTLFVPTCWQGYLDEAAAKGGRDRVPALLGVVRAARAALRPALGDVFVPGSRCYDKPGRSFLDCFTHAGGKRARSPQLKRKRSAVQVCDVDPDPGGAAPKVAHGP
ncbi:hypothetical protein [Streptomyces sp. NPDC058989]|uniref:hypothetical protein n=1 Tax=Streptomyces sp. NPDC058989 TaxID=3346686 RepID=UPI0036B6857A